jgi:hypothetical protein
MNDSKPDSPSALGRARLTVVAHGCVCLIGGLILLLLVPRAAEVYKDFSTRLPIATQWVISLSIWFKQWAIFLVPLGFFLLLADGLLVWLARRFLGKAVAGLYFWLVLAALLLFDAGLVVAVAGHRESPPRALGSFAQELAPRLPPGFRLTVSNATLRLQNDVAFPLTDGRGQVVRAARIDATLSFVPRLSTAEYQRQLDARRSVERVLASTATNSAEHAQAQQRRAQCRVPVFYTEDYSIYVEPTAGRADELSPAEADLEVQRVQYFFREIFQTYQTSITPP